MALHLIIGGAGFIGSHLADALIARGDRVRVLDDLSTGKRGNLPRGAEFIEGDVVNVCTGRAASLLELLVALERVCGRTADRRFGPERPGDFRLSLGAPSKATALLGLKATRRLDQGLAATLGLDEVARAA